MFTTLSDIEKSVLSNSRLKKLVLAAAEDEHALEAVFNAGSKGIIKPILVGDKRKILALADDYGHTLKGIEIHDEPNHSKAVEKAVRIVKAGEAEILMKGKCSTAILLKGILNKEWGMRKGKLLSHFALFELPAYHKLLALTDVAINISPEFEDKVNILQNAVNYMTDLGWDKPKVAAIAAVEVVNSAMPATLDAAALSIMSQRGQIKNCIIDGPLGLDSAIDRESADQKKIKSEVAGDADLLLFPQLEAGNVMYKSLAFLAGGMAASVVLGATAPVVLTSRADSSESKLNSIILAAAQKSGGNS